MAPSSAKGKPGQCVLDITINAMGMRGGEQGQMIKADLEPDREMRTEEKTQQLRAGNLEICINLCTSFAHSG